MSIFGLLQRRTPLFATSELTAINFVERESAEAVLAAAKRVAKKFGVVTSSHTLEAALTAAKNREDYAEAFKAANIHVIDTRSAVMYCNKRLNPTLLERLGSFNRIIYNFLEETLMHGWIGKTSAWLALLGTVPIIASYLYAGRMFEPRIYTSTVMISILVSVVRTLFTIHEENSDSYIVPYITGRWWAGINFILIGVPFIAGANIFWFWFFKGEGGRKWITLPIKDYPEALPNSVVLTIDQVMTALPKAALELEILKPRQGDKDELFVTLPLGGTVDRLYLWHEPAA